ncbi:MAG: HD-GYP domain-containing protein [Candidatus Limnocylindrales bacterium]
MAYGRTLARAFSAPPRATVGRDRVHRLLAVGAIVLLLTMALAVARVTGGDPTPLNHLAYAPIIIAAYLFGLRGGVSAALLVALFLSPFIWPAEASDWDSEVGLVRMVMYLSVGGVTGLLFDRVRHALLGWQTAAVEIGHRERDGMVALARGAEAKDTDTGDHVLRVQLVAERLARAAGLDEERAADVGWSAMLHDVGKLHVPDRILLKPESLDAAEWEIMRLHTIWGEHILENGTGFELARRIARSHHECFDGRGYPDGLRGSAIPFEARIVCIADAFDAITHDRPYRPARSLEWALEELDRYAERQFDPELVRHFVELVRADPALGAKLVDPQRTAMPAWRIDAARRH